MKKSIVLVLLLTTVTVGAKAQFSDYYYHRVGDTIEWRSEIGYYSWWEWQTFYENRLSIDPTRDVIVEGMPMVSIYLLQDSSIFLQRYYTPVPLKIIGIAGAAFRGYADYELGWVHGRDSIQEYFLVYDAIGDSFPLVAQVPWNSMDTMRTLHLSARALPFSGNPGNDSCCSNIGREYYFPLKEYYLDSAIYVMDSFYVGGSIFGNYPNSTNKTSYMGGHVPVSPCSDVTPCNYEFQDTNQCMPIGVSYKVKGYSGPDDMRYYCNHTIPPIQTEPFHSSPWRWMHAPQPAVLMIYPIIEVDTTVPPVSACDPIENVQVTVSGTSATVTWDGFPNYSRVLLRYGMRNEPQSQWREEDVTGSTLYTLTGLQPSMYYGVTLMAECDTSKKETPWSAPVMFYVPADTGGGGTEGVEGATLLSQLTFLQPNPARDEVTVTSSFNLTAIDIWTADGVMVYHGNRSGHDATGYAAAPTSWPSTPTTAPPTNAC